MENLSTLNNFFDGRDESWFYLITVEIEARGAAAVLPVMLAMNAVAKYRSDKEVRDSRTGNGSEVDGATADMNFEGVCCILAD